MKPCPLDSTGAEKIFTVPPLTPGDTPATLTMGVVPTRQLMKAKGLSTIALAREVGCHRTFISHVLAGRRMPSWRYLERLADVLDVPPEYLYRLLRDQQRKEASVGV